MLLQDMDMICEKFRISFKRENDRQINKEGKKRETEREREREREREGEIASNLRRGECGVRQVTHQRWECVFMGS